MAAEKRVEVLYGLEYDPTGKKYTARGTLAVALNKIKGDWLRLLNATVEGYRDVQPTLDIPKSNIVHVVGLTQTE